MEDADAIVLLSLRSVGCQLESNITSLGQFRTEQIITCCARALNIIMPEQEFPTANVNSLPKAAVFRICSNMATAIKKLGFAGDLGYHNFLYPNESDVRNMFLFLVEKLPKSDGEEEAGAIFHQGPTAYNAMIDSLEEAKKNAYWFLPLFQTQYHVPLRDRRYQQAFRDMAQLAYDPATRARARAAEAAYWKQVNADKKDGSSGFSAATPLGAADHIAALPGAAALAALGSGLTSTSASGGADAAAGAFGRTIKFRSDEGDQQYAQLAGEAQATAAEQAAREEGEKQTREEQIAAQQAAIHQAMADIEQADAQAEALVKQAEEAEQSLAGATPEQDGLARQVLIRQRIADMLPQAETSFKELQALSMQSMERIHTLGSEWEEHRGPLVARYRELAAQVAASKAAGVTLSEQIEGLRTEIKGLIAEGRARQQTLRSLKEEAERLGKSANRSTYIKRIGEIHRNLHRQRTDIDKMEMNTLSESLARLFSECDETIFKAARDPKAKDDFAKQVYKFLVALHQGWAKISEHRAALGKYTNQCRDLDNRIQVEQQRSAPQAIEKLEGDLTMMRQENETLKAQLLAQATA
ncbi:hypothetical protein PAPYR_5025 [Paratrimastix pyriformis]|uniref:Coiled-coil domain-containing protein 22 homolog n=1 Tax=Paratrimastix pyriformis TaxID=342808 RepID=A0ABQ8UIC3_9EUKA|nr:hypothetical protein PAPYR_5025 [Paratrimastix pyriformis]